MSRKIDWYGVALWAVLAAMILTVILVLSGTPLALIGSANAGTADLSWQKPTQNCDGSSLTNLTGYEVLYGTKRVVGIPPAALTYGIVGLPPGEWWFSIAALTPTARSEFVTVSKTVAPEDFKTIGTTLYTFVKSEGKILVLPIASTIPVGTVCDATQSVNGKYAVPRSAVLWTGSVKPLVVLADCG